MIQPAMRRVRIENAQHAELLAEVQRGNAAILAEQHVEGCRVQLLATMLGEEIKLSSWSEDQRGGWQCGSSMNLPIWALPELAWLLRRPAPEVAKEHVPTRDPLRIGDIVRHKTGGPRMEISGLTKTGLAWCVWTVNGDTRTAPFELAELVPAKTLLAR